MARCDTCGIDDPYRSSPICTRPDCPNAEKPWGAGVKYAGCPVCKDPDPAAFMRCHRPDCTDGRDRGNPYRPRAYPPPSEPMVKGDSGWKLLGLWLFAVGGWLALVLTIVL